MNTAQRADAGFTLVEEDLVPLREILTIVDGMPLGIMLSAAWANMLPIADIADEIRKSLDFLETELRDLPERHGSIRAVFDYSWALLDDNERSVFSALSVFRGGFAREAAEFVAGASLRTLVSLASKSFWPPIGQPAVSRSMSCSASTALRSSPENRRVDDRKRAAVPHRNSADQRI